MALNRDSERNTHFQGWLSNTGILAAAGLTDFSGVPAHHMEAARQVGHAVEQATLLLDRGRSWKRYSWVEPYIRAWMAFKRDFRFKPELREERLYDYARKITTKPDAWGFSRAGHITVQIKSCVVKDVVGIQTACEEYIIKLHMGMEPTMDSSPDRWGVELRPDGRYRPKRFDDKNDLRVFFAAAKVARDDRSDPEDFQRATSTIKAWIARHK